MDTLLDPVAVGRRAGEVAMALWIAEQLTAFVRANPLTLEATPAAFRGFLAELMDAMTARCRHGA